MKTVISSIKQSLWDDLYNRYFLVFSIVIGLVEYFIWEKYIVEGGIFVYSPLRYFPVQLFLIIIFLHVILSIYSYSKDDHIAHLLVGALPFYAILILILEIMYIRGGV